MPNGGKLKGDINAQHPIAKTCKTSKNWRPVFVFNADRKTSGGARQNSVPDSSFEAFFELCTFTVLPKKLSKQNTLPIQRYMAKVGAAYRLRDDFVW